MDKTTRRPALLAAILSLTLFLPGISFARDRLATLDLDAAAAKRKDQLDWNIAGNIAGTNPNILSELTWKDLEIYEVCLKGKLIMVNNKVPFGGVVKASVRYGEIQSGENQDSDYGQDNRTNEWSRSNNRSDRGDVWDSKVGGGIIFISKRKMFSAIPLAGLSLHLQKLTIHDGYQTISEANPFDITSPPPPVGPIAGLNSTYEAEWRTGWIGLDLEFDLSQHFEVYGGMEFHYGRYEAEANWNLRSDLGHPTSFTHRAEEASGVVANIGLRTGWQNILFNLEVRSQKFEAEDGRATVYFADNTIGVTRLNEINWESFSVGGAITIRF